MLAFEPLRINPVELPPEAWQPERREWVADAYREAARRKIAAAEAKIAPAREKLDMAELSRTGPSAERRRRGAGRRPAP